MAQFADTIVAPFTGPGPAAVTGLRISGPDAWRIAARIFHPWPPLPHHLQAIYGTYSHGDTGLILPFTAGRGYTGDEAVECFLHGSTASVQAFIASAVSHGARLARPGEFTERAFLNGRLSLDQAEAVAAMVESETEAQFRAAQTQLAGDARRRVSELTDRALDIVAAIEASVDFSDEIGDFDPARYAPIHDEVAHRLADFHRDATRAHLVREGAQIAIIGPPNAGKSSLLNAILRQERAIVTDRPGTTRDTITEAVDLEGFRVVLIDTAGLRESHDEVERMGMERSRASAQSADIVWQVRDAATAPEPVPESTPNPDPRVIHVANKVDLAPAQPHEVGVSARTGDIGPLIEVTVAALRNLAPRYAFAPRHAEILARAIPIWAEAGTAMHSHLPPDLTVTLLREFIATLGEITGDQTSPDMLDAIFSRFCLGK